jgi:hypothetical protein
VLLRESFRLTLFCEPDFVTSSRSSHPSAGIREH